MYRDVDFTEFSFTRYILVARSPEKFELVVAELRSTWQALMEMLLSRLPCPKPLLWLGSSTPQPPEQAPGLDGDPALVDRGMVDAIRGMAEHYVEVVLPPETAELSDDGVRRTRGSTKQRPAACPAPLRMR